MTSGLVLASVLFVGAQQQEAPSSTWEASSAGAAGVAGATEAEQLTRAGYGLLFRAAYAVLPTEAAASQTVAGDAPPGGGTSPLGASFLRPSGAVLPSPARPAVPRATLGVLWAAYDMAARRVSPACHLPTTLLAAIGEVESGSLAGRALDANHRVVPPVFGPVLSGGRYAAIRDTDDGRWDGDPVWDRAVGPMQFIPGTWSRWGSDANGDAIADPQNLDDAALSAARYLCAGGRDLSRSDDLRAAILSYNRSNAYLDRVLRLMRSIRPGAAIPVLPFVSATSTPPSTTTSTSPPTTTTPAPTTTSPSTSSEAPTSTTTAPPATAPAPTQTTSEPSTSPSSTSEPAATTATTTAVSPSTTSTTSDSTTSGSTSAESGTSVPPTTP